jgi:hypothetical protein
MTAQILYRTGPGLWFDPRKGQSFTIQPSCKKFVKSAVLVVVRQSLITVVLRQAPKWQFAKQQSAVELVSILPLFYKQLFHTKVFLCSFYVLTIWICNFLAKGFWHKSCS